MATERRIGWLFATFLALLALAATRTAYLAAVKGHSLRRAAVTQQLTQVTVPAARGLIVDRHGVDLAVSEPADNVTATPYLVHDPVTVARRLAPLLNRSFDALLAQLTRRRSGFAYLARSVPAATGDAVARLHIGGITLLPVTRRDYPMGALASQLVGAVGIDGTGLSGLEYSRNRLLLGTAGQRRVTSDAIGQPIAIRDSRVAQPGSSVTLTLDAVLQGQAEQVLSQIGQSYHPKGATAIVMDPRTNQILAMASWPRVDANNIGSAPPYARENRAIGFNYEPGSTFKAFTVAGALQDGVVTPDTSFDLAPQIQVADRTIHDAEARGPVTLTTAQILAQSSNVGAITIGLRLGADRFNYWVRRFGFGRPTGVELPGEERGQVLALDKYSGSSMGNLPIGQGESVTPLQMATAYAAIANGGILRPPHIIGSVNGRPVPLPAGHRIISPQVAAELRRMLQGVLAPGGTASEVSIPGYQLAGKTGTANKVDPATGTYSQSRYVASFVGFAPARNPRLLVSVMADEPQSAIYGGVVAAPAFGQIMSFALPYLRIGPN
ncbi:MAG TPA: penicillin-binding protein 2 [Solirubrobacteraceae bacterium]|nr:penicillin-binding protein 2 [Solirubrobacteraceae bacterium]